MRELILKKIQELLERNPDVLKKWYPSYFFPDLRDEELVNAFEWVVVRCYRQR